METWARLRVTMRDDTWFYLYKLTQGDRVTCAASPAAARARMEEL